MTSRRRAGGSGAPHQAMRPASTGSEAGDRFEQRRLAGAVRADQSEDLAGVHLESDVGERGLVAPALGQAVDLQQRARVAGGRRVTCRIWSPVRVHAQSPRQEAGHYLPLFFSRASTRRAISAGAWSGMAKTELTLISQST